MLAVAPPTPPSRPWAEKNERGQYQTGAKTVNAQQAPPKAVTKKTKLGGAKCMKGRNCVG